MTPNADLRDDRTVYEQARDVTVSVLLALASLILLAVAVGAL